MCYRKSNIYGSRRVIRSLLVVLMKKIIIMSSPLSALSIRVDKWLLQMGVKLKRRKYVFKVSCHKLGEKKQLECFKTWFHCFGLIPRVARNH